MRRSLRTILLSFLTTMLVVVSTTLAWAGPATDAVKTKQTELFKLLAAEANDDNKKKIGALFDEMLDYDVLAQSSLGSDWKTLSADEQKEFTGLLKQLVSKAYEKNLRKVLTYNVEYLSEEKADGAVVVKTQAKHKTDKREEPIAIDFKLADKGGKFRVVDIVTEEVSLVSSYRSQFAKILKKDGFKGLRDKMKEKIAKGDG